MNFMGITDMRAETKRMIVSFKFFHMIIAMGHPYFFMVVGAVLPRAFSKNVGFREGIIKTW